jgi:hypothetical protein
MGEMGISSIGIISRLGGDGIPSRSSIISTPPLGLGDVMPGGLRMGGRSTHFKPQWAPRSIITMPRMSTDGRHLAPAGCGRLE